MNKTYENAYVLFEFEYSPPPEFCYLYFES